MSNEGKFYWIERTSDDSKSIQMNEQHYLYRYRSYINGSTGAWRLTRDLAVANGEIHYRAVKSIISPKPAEITRKMVK